MTEVRKTLEIQLHDGEVTLGTVDVVWHVDGCECSIITVDGMKYLDSRIRAYALDHLIPDEADIADAQAAYNTREDAA